MKPKLWYTNASGDGLLETLANWNFAEDGSGDNPTVIPWVQGYYDHDLVLAYAGGGYGGGDVGVTSIIGADGADITGTCYLSLELAWGPDYLTRGMIFGGTFAAPIINAVGIIYGGKFTAPNFTNWYGEIRGGVFNITGMFFDFPGLVSYPGIEINNDGVPFTGSWEGQDWVDGMIPLTLLFYTNAIGDTIWENRYNWNTSQDGSGAYPARIPWIIGYQRGDWSNGNGIPVYGGYYDADLVDASGGAPANITTGVSGNGECDLNVCLPGYGSIWKGISTDPYDFWDSNFISGGTFTRDNLYLGDNYAVQIFGNPVFTGLNLIINAWYGIYGGTYEITGSQINGINNLTLISITQNGEPFTGLWYGALWSNGQINTAPTIFEGGIYFGGSLAGVDLSRLPNPDDVRAGVGYGPSTADGDYFVGTLQPGNTGPLPTLPDPSDVRQDVAYGVENEFVGTLVVNNTPPSSPINLAQLIGLPPFIKL